VSLLTLKAGIIPPVNLSEDIEMTVINTNVGALNARYHSAKADFFVNKALERLSSGKRINNAADDAAGLAVASKMTSQMLGMRAAIRNTQDGISLVQTAGSSMNEVNNMILRMRELAVQMNNGVYDAKDRDNAQLEVNALLQQINQIAETAQFNGVNLLDGTYNKEIRAGNTNAEVINIFINNMATSQTAKVTEFATEKAIVENDATGPEASGAIANDSASLTRAGNSTNADLNISLDGADGVDADGGDTDLQARDGGVVQIDTAVFSTAFRTAFKNDGLGTFSLVEVGSSATEATSKTYDDATAGDDNFFTIDPKTGVIKSNQAINYTAPASASDADHLTAAKANNFSFIVRYTDRSGNIHNERVNLTIKKATERTLSDIDLTSEADASRSVEVLDKALVEMGGHQASLGALQNRMQYTINNLTKAAMNIEIARGRVMDADFSTETTTLAKHQILSQAASAMLAQANQSKQSVLSLLQ
jgi:flagellin